MGQKDNGCSVLGLEWGVGMKGTYWKKILLKGTDFVWGNGLGYETEDSVQYIWKRFLKICKTKEEKFEFYIIYVYFEMLY